MKNDTRIKVAAVIPAAGSGKRMNAGINKVWLEVAGEPLITYTLRAFQGMEWMDRIVLVVNENELGDFAAYLDGHPVVLQRPVDLVVGGKERQDSVNHGLQFLQKQSDWAGREKVVMIHDAARALVTPEILNQAVMMGEKYPAIGIGIPVKDTIKQVDAEQFVCGTPDRATLWAVQTPQVFDFNILYECHQQASSLGLKFTDDCGVVEHFGYRVKMIKGSYENFKITTPEDLVLADVVLRRRRDADRAGV